MVVSERHKQRKLVDTEEITYQHQEIVGTQEVVGAADAGLDYREDNNQHLPPPPI